MFSKICSKLLYFIITGFPERIRISSIGSVETYLKSEFVSQGINQTLHRVYLQVKCKVNILTPFDSIEREITNQILLVENVIVGNIPNSYYNLDGINGTSDALEVIEWIMYL